MGDWIAQAPALLAAAALLLLPGAPAAWLIGLRGALLPGGAAAISLATVAVAALLAPLAGVHWSPPAVVALAAVVTAAVALIRWLRRSERPVALGRASVWVFSSLALSAVLWIGATAWGMASPAHPAQHFDVVFHLNAVAFVLDHGSASPVDMTMAAPGAAHSFYPTLWHSLTALIVPLAGGVVAATNVMTLAVVGVLWPAAVLFLAASVWPDRQRTLVAAPLLTLAFALYPLGFLNWGALYPNLLGNALVPVVLGLAVLSARRGARPLWQRILVIVALIGAAGATAVAHPSSLLTALALVLPFAVGRVAVAWRTAGTTRAAKVGGTAAVAFGALLLIGVWPSLNVTTNEWMPYESLAQALGEAVALGPVGRPASLLVALLSIIGAATAFRTRSGRWLVGAQLIAAGLFVVAAWLPVLWLRSSIVGLWYDDVVRVGAVLAVAALPLAARGADAVVSRCLTWWRTLPRRASLMRIGAVALVALLVAAPTLLAPRHEVLAMRELSFLASEQSQGLSPDEADLLEEASETLPAGAVVIGDPLTGAGLVYAYTGRRTVFPHIKGVYGPDAALLGTRLREGGPEVCAAVERLGVQYALDFGDRVIFPKYGELYTGLHDLDRSPVLTAIAEEGDATLYRVTGC